MRKTLKRNKQYLKLFSLVVRFELPLFFGRMGGVVPAYSLIY